MKKNIPSLPSPINKNTTIDPFLYSVFTLLFFFSTWPKFDQCWQAPSDCFLCPFDMPPFFFEHLLTFWHNKVFKTCAFIALALKSKIFSKDPYFLSVGIILSLIAFLYYSFKCFRKTSNRICPKPWSYMVIPFSSHAWSSNIPILVVAVKAPNTGVILDTPHSFCASFSPVCLPL